MECLSNYIQTLIISFKFQYPNIVMEKNQSKQQEPKDQKSYIKSKNKWTDYKLHQDIIAALRDQGKNKPTGVQAESLQITTNPDRKKFNYLIRAVNGAGKTMAFLLPMINALEPGVKIVQDKTFKGKLVPNEIFAPQGIIILQNNVLQQQIQQILQLFIDYGKTIKSEKLNFTIGKLDKDKHVFADIIICQTKSFLNRHARGNMKLNNCRFVAIDEVDDIYQHDRDSLAKALQIFKDQKQNPHLITCSATMNNQFLKFYQQNGGQYITNKQRKDQQTGQKITLTGVSNYYMQIQGKPEMHKYIIRTIFKQLYKNADKNKPQVFVFFNSIDEIKQFNQYFQSITSDFTNPETQYLAEVSRGIIAAKKYQNNEKVDMTITQKREIMTKFKNNQTNILLCTNIIARGIDIRNAVLAINVGVPKKSQKDQSIDIDTYLHRVGRTGRHNDKGVALTITETQGETKILITNMKKIHNLDIKKLDSPQNLVKEVHQCILNNAKS